MKHLRTIILGFVVGLTLFPSVCCRAASDVATSPDGRLQLKPVAAGFVVNYSGKELFSIPTVGLGDQTSSVGTLRRVRRIKTNYTMLSGKRLHCSNRANEYAVNLTDNQRMVVRLYDDGLALRYELTGLNSVSAPKENTAFRIADGKRRWMQRWSDGYEGFYPVATSAPANGRWGYPALVEAADGVYALFTEANIERRQSASCLYSNGDVFSVVPDQNEPLISGDWHTPWRVVIVGSLADVVESTLVTDVSEPCNIDRTDWIHPGVVSWIYWANNHGSNDYNIICKYVDMAVTLHLPYVLIDAEWDEMKDGKTIEDAVSYAKSKGIKPLIWYNSSVGWVNGAPGPKYRLNKPEDRERELAWCESIGVVGVKIDFFSGDNQMNMDYYLDLLEATARHHLLVNFHGATVPRGWQRTYPHMLSTEGVYGAEWYNNVPTFTNRAASHNATLPFTRNVIGPMDYTPCAFSDSQHPHITSHAHELALTVLFESGLQHLADRPESFLAQPEAVQQFLGHLPVVWDETLLLDGYPGEYVVMARRSGKTWYIAGINGTDEPKTINVPQARLPKKLHAEQSFLDSGDKQNPWVINTVDAIPATVDCVPRGGFVFVAK
ncbi:MAG: glycoside hydrolase family 97 catalytic domain-containing protein [Bacteroidaceae bacterium]|nr:glycoside hydrolase family 97 catalytic domain-containing protein [Bacteroidaceae bacterium]